MKILAIETSADETAAAVVEDGVKILSNVVASSAAMHEKYGGIVPEVAAREQLKCIIPVIQEALAPLAKNDASLNKTIEQSVDAIAVTIGPGLIGSLLVGVETAKTIAFATRKPIIPVNHVIAHMYANLVISNQLSVNSKTTPKPITDNRSQIIFPAISLVVSGGHTELYLMKSLKDLVWLGGTLDDAAGEAFDKTARLLGFGSRGGVAIQEAASRSEVSLRETHNIHLPRPMINDKSLNFSFSGLKTAVVREWKKCQPLQSGSGLNKGQTPLVTVFAYEVQEAITDVLVKKTLRAARAHHAKSILISGGVAANLRLRDKMSSAMKQFNNVTMYAPPGALCTDNAVYIGSYAYFRGKPLDWHEVTALPDLSVEI